MRTRGIGPETSDLMIVSDYPGRKEDEKGIPLVGKTGDEVNRYLDGEDLPHRRDIYITNLIKEMSPSGDYTEADVRRDEAELLQEIADVEPKVIVALGRWSTRWFLGDVDMDEVQGIPWYWPSRISEGCAAGEISTRSYDVSNDISERGGRGNRVSRGVGDACGVEGNCQHRALVVFPINNPAAGFRNPDMQAKVNHGFRELALFLAGQTQARELFKDDYPNPYYIQVADDPAWLMGLLNGVTDIYVDSEGHPDAVWSVQFCVHPGTAYLIRYTQREMLECFVQWLITAKPCVTYHGSLHDFGIMRIVFQRLKISIEELYHIPFDDSQIMAYLLQLEPVGLKPNCVRHCNMKMQSYDEVLGDAQTLLAHDYLIKVWDAEIKTYRVRQQEAFEEINRTPLMGKDGKVKRAKDGAVKYRRTTVMPKLPMSDLHKAAKRVMMARDPYKLWQEQREDILVAAYNTEINQ